MKPITRMPVGFTQPSLPLGNYLPNTYQMLLSATVFKCQFNTHTLNNWKLRIGPTLLSKQSNIYQIQNKVLIIIIIMKSYKYKKCKKIHCIILHKLDTATSILLQQKMSKSSHNSPRVSIISSSKQDAVLNTKLKHYHIIHI